MNWLKLNHVEYENLEISDANLNTYEDGQIPVQVLFHRKSEMGNRDPTTTAVYDNKDEEGVDDGECPFTVSGLTSDVVDDWENPSAARMAAIEHLQTGQRVLGIGRSKKLVNMSNQPEMITAAFPCLFPYGMGGWRNSRGVNGKKSIQFLDWARHLLMYHDKRFQLDEEFVFFCFNQAQWMQNMLGAHLSTTRRDFAKVVNWLQTSKPSPGVLTRLKEKAERGERPDLNDPEEAGYDRLLRVIQSSSTNVFGSMSSKRNMRKQLWSVVEQIGAP